MIAGTNPGANDGYAVIDKPTGITSHRLLAQLASRIGPKTKAGHAGTLDSFASGVLICLFGRYTRLSEFFMSTCKSYQALIQFGTETTTLDPEGEIVAEGPLPDQATLQRVLPNFQGDIMQTPPAYSAVHINGERAYEKAIRGEIFVPPARQVTIHELQLVSHIDGCAAISVRCSKGTYIRSLARDIALACGSRGHLIALRRDASGPFMVGDATEPGVFDASFLRVLNSATAAGLAMDSIVLDAGDASAFSAGLPLSRLHSFCSHGGLRPLAAFSDEGDFLGIAVPTGGLPRYSVDQIGIGGPVARTAADGTDNPSSRWRYAFVLERRL